MVMLSHDAQGQLDRYLRQVKAALQAHPSVDAGEVERDVMGHIDAELAGQPQPVGATSLRAVLDRLGEPDTWVPSERPPARQTLLHGVLAYFTLALFFAGVILFLGGPIYWPLEPVMMIASFLLARGLLDRLADHDEPAGPTRWLIYPPLVMWYVVFAVVLFVWPMAPIVVALEAPDVQSQVARFVPGPLWMTAAVLVMLAVGIWWTVLGQLLGRFVSATRSAFSPFADWFERRHGARLSLAGVLLAVAAGAIILLLQ